MNERGAVAYIGNATKTYLNVNWKIATGSNDPFAPLSPDEMGLFDAFMHPEYQYLGKVFNEMQYSVESTTGISDALKTRHIYSLTLLGDPSLNILLGEPQELIVDYQYFNDQGLLFMITSQPGAYFSLSDENGELIGADYVGSSGSGFLVNNDFESRYFKLVVTAKNKIPYMEDVFITSVSNDLLPEAELACYPNPFHQYTFIYLHRLERDLPFDEDFAIYNLKGEKVRDFSLTNSNPDFYWRGDDNEGENVSAGIYFLKSHNSSKKMIKKMLYLK